MADQNLRFPPDSTGKRVAHTAYMDIDFTSGTIPFVVGDTVTTPSTGVSGEVIKVTGSASTGTVYILLESGSPAAVNSGEALQVNAVTNALTSGTGTAIYDQNVVIVGGNNPKYGQSVDNIGAAFVRFAEGSPQFDAFGKLQVSQQHKLAEYIPHYDTLPNDFSTVLTGAGSLTHLPNVSGVRLSCGTASGDSVQRTTDEYHVCQAGVSHLIEFTAALGDTGKDNVTRRFGLYDDDNGEFFEMQGTTFNIGLRSKATGTVVEERFASTTWDGDRLDGIGDAHNLSGFMVNPTKNNIYWMDYQCLGAGAVRFGIIIDGVRIVCHELGTDNNRTQSYISTGSLPIRYEQINTGTSASTSEMSVFSSVVKTEGAFTPATAAFTDNSSASVTTTTATPIMAIRASQTFNSINNRSTIYPNSFTIYNGASSGPILFEQWRGVTAAAGSWVSHGGDSVADINKTLTGISGGKSRFSTIVGAGESKQIDLKTFKENRSGIRRKANIAEWVELAFTAKLLSAGAGGTVTVVFNWDEVRA
jgi:hypothetical protein